MLQCLMEVRDNLWESVFSFSCVDPGIELKSSDLVTSTPICRDISPAPYLVNVLLFIVPPVT